MSKKCINCNNSKIYSDTYIRCEKCNNFLRKINQSDEVYKKEEVKVNNQNMEDPYSQYYNVKEDYTKSNKKQQNIEDSYKEYSKKEFSSKKFKADTGKKIQPIAEGIIKNFCEKEVRTFMITKVYRCLTQWTSYTPSNYSNFFQVYSGWGVNDEESEKGQDIIFYGKIGRGNIANNNEVLIYGKKLNNGTIVARKIYNKTTETYIKANYATHPIIILGIILYIIRFIYKLIFYNWSGLFTRIKNFVIFIIFIILIIYISIIKPLKSSSKK
ncbi:hypothetical protein [Clostridium rectalis]|uniref:hypothetical protein n=1 Tax=Clostridium rectalis TaxID=2040295 RepID=UPI000F635591|nr:hypothetical protein [Clostridium rectalis]